MKKPGSLGIYFSPEIRQSYGPLFRDLKRRPRRFWKVIRDRHFIETLFAWKNLGGKVERFIPILGDHRKGAGSVDAHYFNQDILVAQQIFAKNPVRHVDVGSRLDGFIAHVASFRPIEVFDIRSQKTEIPNLIFRQADLMQLDAELLECCDSLSCLHVIEHFGLGRYGDPVDLEGHLKGFLNLTKMVKPGGTFYVSFPIGRARIEYNSCRVFDTHEIFKWPGAENLELERFDFIDDSGRVFSNSRPDVAAKMNPKFFCAIYTFRKLGK
jgi:hypothetical protein